MVVILFLYDTTVFSGKVQKPKRAGDSECR